MNFAFSEEQEQLREAVRRFMEAKSPSSEVRRLMETTEGYDEAVWKQMAQELGLQSLHIPEAHGGQGFTFVELGIVLEEMGRVLMCALDCSDVAARPLGEPGAGWAALSKTLDQAAVGLSNEMVGGAQKVLEMAVDYAKVRVQFGRPIGSFQAIKHKCADMLLEVESAKSAAYYAGWAAAEDSDELPVVASLAKAYCSDAYFHAAAENIQIHGGIGFTWEHDAHLYFKRAKSSELLLGDPTYHRELLAQRIGI